jgi:hypothetical protein
VLLKSRGEIVGWPAHTVKYANFHYDVIELPDIVNDNLKVIPSAKLVSAANIFATTLIFLMPIIFR